jgi:REP element-mobilizing transposase RayT
MAAHVTVKVVKDLPSLRREAEFRVLVGVFEESCEREGFRLVHFSVQHSHLHMIVEAESRAELTSGMRALLVRVSRGLNTLWERRGQVVAERFHEHLLRTPREVRNALAYVLNNARRHGARISTTCPDSRSSGLFFDGWLDFAAFHMPDLVRPVAAACSWILTVGWRKHGLIPLGIVPGS